MAKQLNSREVIEAYFDGVREGIERGASLDMSNYTGETHNAKLAAIRLANSQESEALGSFDNHNDEMILAAKRRAGVIP